MKNALYNGILLEAFKTYNIRGLDYTSASDFLCNAMVYQEGNAYYVVAKEGLPEEVEFFSLLHEAGHVAKGHLTASPLRNWSEETELETNLWALDYIKPHISQDLYQNLYNLFHRSEKEAFMYLKQALKDDVTPTKEIL